MTANVGTFDRLFRMIAGVILIALPFVTDLPIFANDLYKYGAIVVGLVMLGTAAMRFCPAYRIFGFRTCKVGD